ncbi:heavy metal translocating P-type ATPase [Brevibacterium sp. 91QC2O2]|uniref:heavy metal translocating P-type ATPase n=1 Tax=Brevibacterium TaxID=1696 RepID=UPI00211C2302|nr:MULTISPECIES: heavy metal translocating P-type ATPase [unclassified Brevibacterium]MCQ9367848.1 heavy metal translocating P-type ATPase [Brevibacterium sp. 91QC2O2]MCQ9386144.1 heavy metal translocating P-type ATPase [Brevibacterium sp. 68QC2CO]
MSRFSSLVRAYPLVIATLLVAMIGLVLLATPASESASWIVGAYALVIAGWEAVGMIRQLIRGHAGLDILAVTAITAAVLVGEPWAALVVVLMLTGGAALEDYAENRSKRELTALLRKAPQQATRILAPSALGADMHGHTAEVTTEDIPVEEVEVGDLLLVRPGALVPVDSILVSEHAVFDESSLTGESLPVERDAGEKVSSGAVNGQAAVTMRAAAPAAESEYQQIVRLVEQAAGSKAKVVRLADRYAVPFTVLALVIAGIAWAVSGEAVRFAEVLVVATPCPLLIAAPVAFLGGMSRAARFGLIVKGGGTLEQLSRARSAAFDKTGTITTGKPVLERILPAARTGKDELLRFAASAEVYSSHVLAGSVVQAAKQHGLSLIEAEHAEEIATNGVAAVLRTPDASEAVTVRIGKPSWVRDSAPDLVLADLAPGELAIYVSVDDRFAGAIVMRDQVREEASQALQDLGELGIVRTLMVTGDVAATAEPIAQHLGIGEVHAECRPGDKVRIVSSVQPRPLIMVGDGLNDAPVLAAADIGFAMGARGATAASESADIVNRYDTLSALPRAVSIGKDTVRIALQSIWLGIIISVGLMLIAAFGFLPALLGAWLQEVVDLVAILGALRAVGPRSERITRSSPVASTEQLHFSTTQDRK